MNRKTLGQRLKNLFGSGGEIAGKSDCESLCFSGGSHTTDNGPTLNPYDHTRTTGGSSAPLRGFIP